MKIKSYAKVNLSLEVINKRSDGYHNIESIVQNISIHDVISIKVNSNTEKIFIVSDVNDPNFPIDDSNIIVKAARLFLEHIKRKCGLMIFIRKNIPIGAGLGGGSSNAAATLVLLNRIFGNKLEFQTIFDIASELGSDVPLFLYPGTKGISETGKIVRTVGLLKGTPTVVVKPKTSISTKNAYDNFKLDDLTKPIGCSRKICSLFEGLREPTTMTPDELYRSFLLSLGQYCRNVFELSCNIASEISELKSLMFKSGAVIALMTGTGSAVFGAFYNYENARASCRIIAEMGLRPCICKFVERGSEIIC